MKKKTFRPPAARSASRDAAVAAKLSAPGVPSPPAPPATPSAASGPALPTPAPAAVPPSPARAPYTPKDPPFRKLRGYAIDPALDTDLATRQVSHITFEVPWEKLERGPAGEYVEVVDIDPATGCCYEPVNLDDPILLAQDGLAPSEGTPQFHQQMVYAVASLTIRNFEHALGRKTLWRHQRNPADEFDDKAFCQHLRIYPHALRARNAYYSPERIALLFGYFKASSDDPGGHMGGSMVFTCLSHDIVAHETTHALLDGMNRNFLNPSNPDVHAFHEAFADIVALFQHFTFPEILRHQIVTTRGDIASQESLLSQLAGQFGRSTGKRGALRKYIGEKPDPAQYQGKDNPVFLEAHNRGALLVAAVFEAFLSIYARRTADIVRLATDGTGVMRPGAIHPDLAQRLADEAARTARHVLTMCVRAIDYCPPVDITFGEFLRAVITADVDLVPDDKLHYRIAFLQAFRQRGIYPRDVRTLSVESLLWRGPENDESRPSNALNAALRSLRGFVTAHTYVKSRKELFDLQRGMRVAVHKKLKACFKLPITGDNDALYLGVEAGRKFEVRTGRIALRTSPDGVIVPQLLIGLYQEKKIKDPARPNGEPMRFEGGSTVIADLRAEQIRYCVRKPLCSQSRQDRQRDFAASAGNSLRATYFGLKATLEPIAAIHCD